MHASARKHTMTSTALIYHIHTSGMHAPVPKQNTSMDAQHAHTSTKKKNALIAPRTHQKKKCNHSHTKKNAHSSTNMHACGGVVRACVCVDICAACTHQHKQYTDQHRTHIHTSGMHAPVPKQNTSTSTKNTLSRTVFTNQKKKMRPPQKNAHSSTSMRTWWWYACVRACVYVCGSTYYSHPPR